ncbi:hypothetical protein AWY79_02295 [Pseudodesulfovibrio indicus]|uniref:Uncharacterized protein n=1 Tax=Pseudodesulfovibrio indicus TaxID=1716143 RepID=A0ABM5YRP9_9BACT|nr:hypothetical protein AWY79_02295 [Pseudodesulfovibrio indicus]
MTPGIPVRFDFDLSGAVFAASGDDLVIGCPDGGCVVLREYLVLASEGELPVFELLNGERVPGETYLFAFAPDMGPEPELETKADGAATGSGSGEYADDPGSLADGLNAVGGQGDAYSPHAAPPLVQGISPLGAIDSPLGTETEAGPTDGGSTDGGSTDGGSTDGGSTDGGPPGNHGGGPVFEEQMDVQILLNPGFEASGYRGSTWGYVDDLGNWRNLGDVDNQLSPQFFFSPKTSALRCPPAQDDGAMKTWGTDMDQKPEEGVRLMELDARSGADDTLTQAVATQAGQSVTVTFSFTPRAGEDGESGLSSNDFKVTLGDQLVAAVTWDADFGDGAWLVTLGHGVTTSDGSDRDFHFTNDGYVDGSDDAATDWTRLSFNLTADRDHAELTFSEYADHNDGYGTLLDSVSVERGFDSYVVGDSQEGLEFLAGTDGDDALFGSPRGVVDGTETGISFAEVIDGGDGDDALYGGQNFLTVLSGGEGDDFIVAGRPLTHGMEESQDMDSGVGVNLILPGSGNDYIRLGDGDDAILLNREALVNGETLVVEGFDPGSGQGTADQLFLADGLSVLGPATYGGDGMHLLVGDGTASVEVTLLGLAPTSLDKFLVTGPEADILDDQVQQIIDSGGAALLA